MDDKFQNKNGILYAIHADVVRHALKQNLVLKNSDLNIILRILTTVCLYDRRSTHDHNSWVVLNKEEVLGLYKQLLLNNNIHSQYFSKVLLLLHDIYALYLGKYCISSDNICTYGTWLYTKDVNPGMENSILLSELDYLYKWGLKNKVPSTTTSNLYFKFALHFLQLEG